MKDQASGAVEIPEAGGLLDAVLDAPEDEGPRRVYADYLLERGHPLGAWLTVAFDPWAPPAELTSDERVAWCQRLLGPVDPWRVELRHGFPFRLYVDGELPSELVRWATLQEVAWRRLPLLLPRSLPALSSVRTLRAVYLMATEAPRPSWLQEAVYQLENLELREIGLPADWLRGFELEVWPQLERLTLWVGGFWQYLDEAQLGAAGQHPLEVGLASSSVHRSELVHRALVASRSCAPGVQRVVIKHLSPESEGVEVSLDRGTGFRELRFSRVHPRNATLLGGLIARVSPVNIDGLAVETPRPEDERFLRQVRRSLGPLLDEGVPLRLIPPTARP